MWLSLILLFSPFAWSRCLSPSSFSTQGQFSSNYFLLNGYDPKTEMSFSYYVDKTGHLIAVIPAEGKASDDSRTRVILSKPGEGRTLWQLRPYNESQLVQKNFKGEILKNFTPALLPLHHDFQVGPQGEIFFLSHSVFPLRKNRQSATQRYLGNPVYRWDKDSEPSWLWEPLTPFLPFLDLDWTPGGADSYPAWTFSGVAPADHNPIHANSLEFSPKFGWLLSFRSLNRVALIDPDWKQVRWTLGPSTQNTLSTKGTAGEFYRQHHATFTQSPGILLFDNGRTKSRVLKFSLSDSGDIEGLTKVYEPDPPLFSQRHGSAVELSNGHILAFFPHTSNETRDVNTLIEFDGVTGKTLGRMLLNIGSSSSGYRAYPVAEAPSISESLHIPCFPGKTIVPASH